MRIETIAFGGPRTVKWQGHEVVTSILKTPVPGPVAVREHNLEGDRKAIRSRVAGVVPEEAHRRGRRDAA